MTLHIPYTNPKGSPWIFYIDGLFALTEPSSKNNYDESKEAQKIKLNKEIKLNALEAKWWKVSCIK